MSTEKQEKKRLLIPVLDTNDITTDIIKRCEKLLKDDAEYKDIKKEGITFESVIPYRSPYSENEICFQASCVFKFVGRYDNMHRDLKTKFKPGKDYFKHKMFDDKNQPDNILTRKGLMKTMYMGKTKLAEIFQDYIFELLDNLWENEKQMMVKEMEQVEIKLKKQIDAEKERTDRQQERIGTLEESNCYNNNLAMKLDKVDNFLKSEPFMGNDERKELTILRELHMKKVGVYLVDQEYMKRPTKKQKTKKAPRKKGEHLMDMSDSESDNEDDPLNDEDEVNYDMPYNCVNVIHLKNELADEPMYFCIEPFGARVAKDQSTKDKNGKEKSGKEKYHKVFDLHIHNSDNYKELINKLTDSYSKTHMKSVFKTTYNTIMNNKSRVFIDSQKELFKDLRGARLKRF